MKARKTSVVLILFSVCFSSYSQEAPYKDASLPVDARVSDLLSRMTLKEKIEQLSNYPLGRNTNPNNIGDEIQKYPTGAGTFIYYNDTPEVGNDIQRRAMETRLGIPALFGFDVIHGYRTIFPAPLAQAASWNRDLVYQSCRIAAEEASTAGIVWTYSPMIDIARDPRWGRIIEGYGEDPYATAEFCKTAVRGYQGEGLGIKGNIAACLKHYTGYGASEAGRDYVFSEVSAQTLWDTYLPPYKAGVEAGAASVMSAFNTYAGIPCTGNRFLLRDILKDRWGFKGFVVSDWDAVIQICYAGMAADGKEAAEIAINAGVDVDMRDDLYVQYLEELVKEGRVDVSTIDDAVARLLKVKFELGLFDHPFVEMTDVSTVYLTDDKKAVAEKLASESCVLLENRDGVLPLDHPGVISVIGPLAAADRDLMGPWIASGRAEDVTCILDGVKKEFPGAEVLYSQGCGLEKEIPGGFEDACTKALSSDIVILCLGESYKWSGENASRASILLPDVQLELLDRLAAVGKRIVLVLVNGRPLDLHAVSPACAAVLETWHPGTMGGPAIAGILSGRFNPSGKLPVTFPYNIGQIPIYYNRHRPLRLPKKGWYQDMTVDPMYEFGYGLSYSSFEYSDITVKKKNGRFLASVTVTNTSGRDGQESVLWFISDPVCSIPRPIKELKYFEKKTIPAGKSVKYVFEIDPSRDLSYVDGEGNPVLEKGKFVISVADRTSEIEL